MLRFLIYRPIAVLMSCLGLLILGGIATQLLPISILPEIPIPQITIQISSPNVSARELENTVTRPLRNQLLQVSNLKDISSQTRNNTATILLEFDFGTNTNLAFIEVNEKVDHAMDNLPKSLERPRILKANIADIPVFHLSIFSKDTKWQNPLELSEFARSILKRRIEQLSQVAFVDISGFAEPAIQLIPNRSLLQSLKLEEADFTRILNDNNLELGTILLKDGQYQYNIRFLSTLKTVSDIENIYFKHQGRVLQLKEIVKVQLQAQQPRGKYFYNGQEAIILTIRKQADAQLFALKKEFQKLLKSFHKDYPTIGFALSNDQSELLEISINNLQSGLFYGAGFAFLILFIFFREWKLPVLIGLSIPTALTISILGFYLVGISINIISLSGLILGVGLMIDNAIIILDNIRQYQHKGVSISMACIKGANEVIRPLLSSTLTTCSVFLPLIFLSGIAGALFYDQAIAISIALSASLLVAYFLLPVLVRLVVSTKEIEGKAFRKINFYTHSVDFVLNHKVLFLLFFIIFIMVGFWEFSKLRKEIFPQLTRTAFALSIDWNESISIEENYRRNQHLLGFLTKQDSLSSQTFVGEEQFSLQPTTQSINESKLFLYKKRPIEREKRDVAEFFRQYYPNVSSIQSDH